MASEPEPEMTPEERTARKIAQRKLRYQTDPSYRERVLAYNKSQRVKNPEAHRARAKARREGPMREAILQKKRDEHKAKPKGFRKVYFDARKSEKSEYDRKRREAKGAELAAQQKTWRGKNQGRLNTYCRTKRKTDPQYGIKNNLRCRMNTALRAVGLKRDKPLEQLIGCTIPELRSHLEAQFTEGMTWANRGHTGRVWHIDHKKPCASFDLTDPAQQATCFHFTNLQPLWARDNMSKGDKVA